MKLEWQEHVLGDAITQSRLPRSHTILVPASARSLAPYVEQGSCSCSDTVEINCDFISGILWRLVWCDGELKIGVCGSNICSRTACAEQVVLVPHLDR